MILAQGSTTFPVSGEWAAFFAFVALIIKDFGKWFADWLKDKKEERQTQKDREAKAFNDAQLQHTLDGILKANNDQTRVMGELKSQNDKSHSLDRMRFEVLNSKADKSICKADCPIDQKKYRITPP